MHTAPARPALTQPAQRADTPPKPVAAIAPALPLPRKAPSWLRGTHTRIDARGHRVAAGTVGEHAAGLLDTAPDTPDGVLDADPVPTDQLVADLTAAMQGMAATAALTRYSDLIPYLAKTLICHGWVDPAGPR
jgi:hypothetical protein